MSKLDLVIPKIISLQISFRAAFFVVATLVLLVTPFLALPAQASPEVTSDKIKLNGAFTLNVPLPVQRDDIQVEILPKIDVGLKWEGTIFNQKLKLIPKGLLLPDQIYRVEIKNVKNPLGISSSSFTFTFKTETYPKVVKLSPHPKAGKITPNQKFYITLDKGVSYGKFQAVPNPYFESSIEQKGDLLTITPKTPLKQGVESTISLWFTAKGLPSIELLKESFAAVTPLKVIKTVPASGVKNASKKSELIISFNKDLQEKDLSQFVKIRPAVDGEFNLVNPKALRFKPKAKLTTGTDYKVIIDRTIEATDGAILDKDFELKFKTAGAVVVTAAWPQGWGIPLNSTISITFDQIVDNKLAEQSFNISPKVDGNFSWSGNTMYFVPNGGWGLFKEYSFSLSKGITSPGGDPSTQRFTYTFRSTLERQRSLGTSIRGRSIIAYYFGVGAKKIMLVGAMHGSEANTASLLNEWVVYLRGHQSQIAADRTFIIVPNANPDGVATGSRFNTRGVDLNRNFQTPTWQKDTYWNNGVVKGGGGGAPFSEPESRALRDLLLKENPMFTISYHSAAGVVVSDGISNQLRNWYSGKTGYANVAGAPLPAEDVFNYDVTGSLEEWQGERSKIVIVVELATYSSSEYSRNLPALKGLLTY